MSKLEVGQRVRHLRWGMGTVADPKAVAYLNFGKVAIEFDNITDYGKVVAVTEELLHKIGGMNMIDLESAKKMADEANLETTEGQALKRLISHIRRQDILIAKLKGEAT